MQLNENVPLSIFSTMRLGGLARFVVTVNSRPELTEAIAWAEERRLPILMVGGGSNIVWKDEGFQGLLIVNQIIRYEIFDEDGRSVYITAGSGENWDSVVERSTNDGLTGIEALSLIPGSAGAAPVQNIGAYGQDLSQTLATIEAYDMQLHSYVTIPAADCEFGYRTSRFNRNDRGRFFITAITLHLTRGLPQPPYYKAVEEYLNSRQITNPTPQMIRDAVVGIRLAKLPDPAKVANCGSFFANPIVDDGVVVQLHADYPDMPTWPAGNGRSKIPAAWLIEQAGLKGYRDPQTGMSTWHTQPLVFVNESAKNTADLLSFKQKIVGAVQTKFNITLIQEPELLPL